MKADKLVVRRIGVTSAGTIFGALYALFGLIAGAIITMLSIIGAALTQSLTSVVFGMGAIIALPIFYGIIGFIGGVIFAALFNFVTGYVGGLELETE
jgi:uncharacterized membrane protein YGL010W